MKKTPPAAYGQIHCVQMNRGFRIVDAPKRVRIAECFLDGSTPMALAISVLNGYVTIRGIERTVVYKLERQSHDDLVNEWRRAVKAYDDADIGVRAGVA